MSLNRDDSNPSVAAVNLDGAEMGFKVTGDAAWNTDSDDWAMFSDEANQMVAGMVKTFRNPKFSFPTEDAAYAWLSSSISEISEVYPEVYDTMVRETVAYALDDVWMERYGEKVDQWELVRSRV